MSDFIPPLFKRFGKGLSDLFKEQFEYKKYIKVKSSTNNGVALETTGEALKSGDYSGNLKATYKQSDIGTFEAELNTSGATNYSVKADKLTKGLTVKVSGDEKPAGKLEVDFAQEFYSTSLGVDVSKDTTSVDGAGVIGFDGLSVGGAVKYDATAQALSDYNAGVEYTQSDFTATVKTTNQADRVQTSFLQKVNPDLTFGGLFSYDIISGKRVLTVGGSYKVNEDNTAKLKADSEGIVSSVLEARLRKSSAKLLLSAEHNLRNQTTVPEKFGLGLIFGDD
jgi:voltage-dependent anion channel protein 2